MSYHKHIRRNTTEYQQELKEITNPGEMDKANRPFGKEELEKGAKGDWQKEGYTIHKTYLNREDAEGWKALKDANKNGMNGGIYLRPAQNEEGSGDNFYELYKNPEELVLSGSHVLDGMGPFIYAKDSSGNVVAGLIHDRNEILNNWVHENHRRKGISTALHQIANSENEESLKPGSLSEEGKKLWSEREKEMRSKSKKLFNKQELDKLSKGFADIYELLVKARKNIVYVSTDGDDIGASVERAAMSNDLKEIKKQDKIIKKGNQVIRNWIKKRKGVVYIDGGDDISFTINRRHLNDLEDMRKRYHDATGYTLTVGVGDSISEAAHAMVYGKLKGKNQINKWSKEIESVVSQHDEKPEEKYTKEGLLTKE